MESKREKPVRAASSMRRGIGIAGKLVAAVVVSMAIALSLLLSYMNRNMSKTLLDKSEDILRATTERTIQETKAWMNKTLAMLEAQRDTIEYEDMDVPELKNFIKHTADQNEAYPAGLYAALTDGSLHHASFVPGADFDALSKSWYKDGIVSEEFILGDVYFDEDSQSYVVGASGMLRDGGGKVRGVAAADVYLDSISKIVSGIQIEDTGGIFLVDARTNTIIGHKDSEITGQKLDKMEDGIYAYVNEQIKGGQTGLSVWADTYIQVENIPDSDWKSVSYVSKSEVLQELIVLSRFFNISAVAV